MSALQKRGCLFVISVVGLMVALLALPGCGGGSGNENTNKAGISISFDDNFFMDFNAVRPLLKKYGAVATFYVYGLDKLPPEDIKVLQDLKDDGHEIACHGFRHVVAAPYVAEHSLAEYISTEITPAIDSMTKKGFPPTTFAYPRGSQNNEIDNALLKYFHIVRGSAPPPFDLPVRALDEYYYKWNNKRSLKSLGIGRWGNTTDDLINGMQRALENGEVLMLVGHNPAGSSLDVVVDPNALNIPLDKLEDILSAAKSMGLKFYRVADL